MMNNDRAHAEVAAVLAQAQRNGVYRLAAAERLAPAFPVLAGDRLLNKAALLQAVAQAFDFPADYGENWDALEECLGDMSWWQGPIALLIQQADAIPLETLNMFLAIFSDVAAQWAEEDRPCSLFLSGLQQADIPLLG